ncbi:hypothetical protein CRYUN_Cryun30bG0093400 [Craigia yunnanensis]
MMNEGIATKIGRKLGTLKEVYNNKSSWGHIDIEFEKGESKQGKTETEESRGQGGEGAVNRKLCMETSKQSGRNQGDQQIIRTINGIANDQGLMEKNEERNTVLGSTEGGWSNLERGCENIKGENTWIHGRISKNQSALKLKTDGGAKLGFGIDAVELNEVDFGLANVAIVSAYLWSIGFDYTNT